MISDWPPNWSFAAAALELAAVDLLLGGDNAILIALAARVLPADQRRRAMVYAVGGAIGLRFAFAAATGALLRLPLVRFVGGVALLAIAVELLARAARGEDEEEAVAPNPKARRRSFWSGVGVIILADAAMSLDNVVALASIAQGNLPLLAIGILLGIPPLVFSAYLVSGLLNRFPILIYAGGALLGWIAGEMAADDKLWASWIAARAPILTTVTPALFALYAVIAGRVRAIYGARPVPGGALGKWLARRSGVFTTRAYELYAKRAAAHAVKRRLILAGLAATFIAVGAVAARYAAAH